MNLVPERIGAERIEVGNGGAKAFAGTGFDPHSMQHRQGADAVRYAIALQCLRDAKDFDALDEAREAVTGGYFVMQETDGTRLFPKPQGWHRMSAQERKAFRLEDYRPEIIDGIMYDTLQRAERS